MLKKLLATAVLLCLNLSFFAQGASADPDFVTTPGFGLEGRLECITRDIAGNIYVGGEVHSYHGQTISNFVKLFPNGSIDPTFLSVSADAAIRAIKVQTNGQIVIAGSFNSVSGVPANGVARINTNGTIDATFCANTGMGIDGAVTCLEVDGSGRIYLGGHFTTFDGQTNSSLVRLLSTGLVDQSYPAMVMDGGVNTLKLEATGRLWVGGAFTMINSVPAPAITRLLNNGTTDPNLSLSPGTTNGVVNSIAIQSTGPVIVGGSFSQFCGASINNLCRLNYNGSIDAGFLSGTGPNDLVNVVLTYSDNRIFIGGAFTAYNSTPRNYSARLLINGAIDPAFDPLAGTNNGLRAAVVQPDKKIAAIGKFSNYMGADVGMIYRTQGSFTVTSIPSKTLCSGAVLTLTAPVTACSGATYSYQWYCNNNLLSNATTSVYVVPSAQPVHTGTYHCIVSSSSCGSATSNSVNVLVNQTTNIITQPVSTTVCVGSSATFSVEAVGTNLTYQWSCSLLGNVGTNSPTYSYVPTNGVNPSSFRCYVAGTCSNVMSGSASLNVKTNNAAISSNAVSFCEGGTLSVTVTPGGINPACQWYFNNVAIPGATSPTYSKANATSADAGGYKCVVVSACGTATSPVITASTNQMPVITNQPISVTACQNGAAFTIGVSGGSISNKWYKNGSLVATTSSGSYMPPTNTNSNGTYSCVSTNACGSVTSNTVIYTLSNPVLITTQPVSTQFCFAGNGSLTVAANGPGTLTYQWFDGTTAIPNATLSTLDYTNLTQTKNYKCVVTNGCFTATTTPATITIIPALTFIPKPAGSPYQTFNANISTTVGMAEAICSLPLSNGRVLVGGTFNLVNTVLKSHLVCLDSNGVIVNSFNVGNGANGSVYALAMQPDGQVLVGGAFTSINGSNGKGIQRLSPTGVFDAGFTANCGTGPAGNIYSIAIQDDGKILLTGNFASFNGVARGGIVRLNADGTVDQTFGYNGSGTNNNVYKVVVQKDDKIIITGFFTTVNGVSKKFIARLNPDGSLDNTFNQGGSGPDGDLLGCAVQPDGKIIITGYFGSYNGVVHHHFARLNSDGTPDMAFNAGYGMNAVMYRSPLVQPDGKIIPTGWGTAYNGVPKAYLMRINPDGSYDSNFLQSFWPGPNNYTLYSHLNADNSIFVDGAFSQYDQTPHSRVAKVYNEMNVFPQNPTVCNNGVISLSVPNMGQDVSKIVWRLNGSPVAYGTLTYSVLASGTAAGTYSVSLEDVCSSLLLGSTVVNVAAPGAIVTQPANNNACAGSPVSVAVGTSGYVSGYQWFKNRIPVAGATQASLTFNAAQVADAGTYVCKVFTACGAIYSASASINVATCSGQGGGLNTGRMATAASSENENDHALTVNVYPNPNNGLINIDCNSEEQLTAKIVTMQGQELMKTTFETTTRWNVSTLRSGMYVFQVYSHEGILLKSIRIVVE